MFDLRHAPDESTEGPLLPRKTKVEDPSFDITAMIDLVFLMNLYFLVKTLDTTLAEVDLPPAQHAVAADVEGSLTVTVLANADGGALVDLGDGQGPRALTESSEEEIEAAVQQAAQEGRNSVLIKAERDVLHRDVSRVAHAASAVEDVRLNLAVLESDSLP